MGGLNIYSGYLILLINYLANVNVLFDGIELGLAQVLLGVDIVLRVLIQKPPDRLCRRVCGGHPELFPLPQFGALR